MKKSFEEKVEEKELIRKVRYAKQHGCTIAVCKNGVYMGIDTYFETLTIGEMYNH